MSTARQRSRTATARRLLRAAAGAAVGALVLLPGASTSPAQAVPAGPSPAAPLRAVPLPPTGPDGAWWFTAWRIKDVWATGARGQGVTVAVFDSGVNQVPELRGVVLPGLDRDGGDGRTDTDGHGTRMALLVAGQGGARRLVGVAPGARILPVDSARVDEGIRWAVDHGAKVVNMSFDTAASCDPLLAEAVAYALERGAVLVASSGNEGEVGGEDVRQPVNCPGVLGVGAVDIDARPWSKTQVSRYADVAAPGVRMRSMDVKGRIGFSSGTSDAAALVSGAVALVWSKDPTLTNRQVVARLLATARDAGAPGKDDRTGYGIVRPYQAITADVPPDAPNPVFDEVVAAATASATAAAPAFAPSSPRGGGPAGWLPGLLVGGAVGVGGLVVGAALVAAARSKRRAGR